jgi:alpha-mannosidase
VSAGTERQDVSNDYAQRISEGHVEVEAGVALSLRKLAGIPPAAEVGHCNCNAAGNCLNLSMCAFTTAAESFTVMAWNTQGQNVSSWLRVVCDGVVGPCATRHYGRLSCPLRYGQHFSDIVLV